MQLNIKSFAFLAFILLFATESIFAAAIKKYDSLIVFGDSYSDNGNGLFKVSNGTFPPSPPYFKGRMCNGPVWVEYLSDRLGLPLTDKAAAAATTNSLFVPSEAGPNRIVVPGVRQQIDAYIQEKGNGKHNDKDLYVVVAIGNDYLYSIEHGQIAKPEQVVEEFMADLQILQTKLGAVNFLVSTLPKFGDTPAFANFTQPDLEFFAKVVETHNQLLRSALNAFTKNSKVNVFLIDAVKFFEQFNSSNLNLKEACLTFDSNGIPHVCANPDEFMFWDGVHLTTKRHEKLASDVIDLLLA